MELSAYLLITYLVCGLIILIAAYLDRTWEWNSPDYWLLLVGLILLSPVILPLLILGALGTSRRR